MLDYWSEHQLSEEYKQILLSRKRIAKIHTVGMGLIAVISIIVMLVYCKTPLSRPFLFAAMNAVIFAISSIVGFVGLIANKKALARFDPNNNQKDKKEKTK